jgi:hypothetical protein
MSLFNAKAFFAACQYKRDIALPAFLAAFSMPAQSHIDGEELLEVIKAHHIESRFNAGKWVVVYDHSVNKSDYSFDEVLRVNNKGEYRLICGGSCGNGDSDGNLYKALKEGIVRSYSKDLSGVSHSYYTECIMAGFEG